MIGGLAEQVIAMLNQQPPGWVGVRLPRILACQVDGLVALLNPNEAIEENEAAKRTITTWRINGIERCFALQL